MAMKQSNKANLFMAGGATIASLGGAILIFNTLTNDKKAKYLEDFKKDPLATSFTDADSQYCQETKPKIEQCVHHTATMRAEKFQEDVNTTSITDPSLVGSLVLIYGVAVAGFGVRKWKKYRNAANKESATFTPPER